MSSSDWSSGVWSSELAWVRTIVEVLRGFSVGGHPMGRLLNATASAEVWWDGEMIGRNGRPNSTAVGELPGRIQVVFALDDLQLQAGGHRLLMRLSQQHGSAMRSEEHTSELQSLMRISYAVFCLKTKI